MSDDFLLGQDVELAVLLHRVDVVQALDAGLHRAEIGQRAAQPAVVHIEHAAALGLSLDGLLGLLLGADEQDALALQRDVAHEHISFVDLANGLLQVDDVDAVALGEDVLGHLRVPAAGLVAEVNAGLQQLLHGNDCHSGFPSLFFPPPASTPRGTMRALPPTVNRRANRQKCVLPENYNTIHGAYSRPES